MKYFVTIAGRTLEVEVNGDAVSVDGAVQVAELRAVAGTPVRNLLLGSSSWIIPMEADGPGRWLVQRRGERFEVEVVDERTHYIRSLVGEGQGAAGPPDLRAPMPGLVVRLLVEPGAAVEAGRGLLVLEAMKMENELKAPAAGQVADIKVKPGQPVEKGAVLVTFR